MDRQPGIVVEDCTLVRGEGELSRRRRETNRNRTYHNHRTNSNAIGKVTWHDRRERIDVYKLQEYRKGGFSLGQGYTRRIVPE